VLSFLALIVFGTVGLMVLPGLYVGEGISWLDALFTATSAVCVTGLIVVDTATYFTGAGQAFLLVLIQLGGLGILTFTTLVILALGRRLSLHHEAVTATAADLAPDIDFKHLIRHIFRLTFIFEAAGAFLLFVAWLPRFEPGEAAWHAAFHAVSAFCNAGFSTFSDSLTQFQGAPLSLTVLMALIVLGGIGFLTLEEIRLQWRNRKRGVLTLHSRLVLSTTALLLVGGWVALTTLEWSNTLAGMPVGQRLVNGLFMSATARTAGFNTVDYGATASGTSFLTILLMSIGGSPGSTAGGLKTTTAAVIAALAVSRLRGRQVTSVRHRSLPDETVHRAIGLFVVGFLLVSAAILLFSVMQLAPGSSEPTDGFLRYMFEAVSAFNTVGLSMGATSELGPPSKVIAILLMYIGRVGPLTFAAAFTLSRPTVSEEFRYAREDVIIG